VPPKTSFAVAAGVAVDGDGNYLSTHFTTTAEAARPGAAPTRSGCHEEKTRPVTARFGAAGGARRWQLRGTCRRGRERRFEAERGRRSQGD